jgi:integrase
MHLVPGLGTITLAKLRPIDIQRFETNLLERGRADGKGGLSARSVLHVHRCLSAALSEAVRLEMIAVNPADAVRPPRPERPTVSIPDAQTVGRVLEAATGSRYYTALLVSATTGMRRGEVLAVRWTDVDLDGSRLRVIGTLQRVGHELVVSELKTDRSRRTVTLPPVAVEALRRHRREQNERRLLAGEAWVDRGLVFDNGLGGYVEPSELSHALRRAATKAGVPDLRLHDLRHSFATTLLAAGVHPKIASEALGHATIAITLDTYSHVLPGMGDVAAQAIQSAYEGVLPASGSEPSEAVLDGV